MSEDKAGSSKPFDPFEQFHSMRDAYLDGMAKVMVDAVNTEAYAQATGAAVGAPIAPLRAMTCRSESLLLPIAYRAFRRIVIHCWPRAFFTP